MADLPNTKLFFKITSPSDKEGLAGRMLLARIQYLFCILPSSSGHTKKIEIMNEEGRVQLWGSSLA